MIEINFLNPVYLLHGNEAQRAAYSVLRNYRVFESLAEFSPVLTGTVPLGIDVEGSDLDIACYWKHKETFSEALVMAFSAHHDFKISQKRIADHDTVIAQFLVDRFMVEIFGQNRPVEDQQSFRHMCIEWKILQHKGEEFKKQVILLKKAGIKTEPAFAKLLGLRGDPYVAMLEYKVDEK